jgi:hypothetical protein
LVLLAGKESYLSLKLGLKKLFDSINSITTKQTHVHLDLVTPFLPHSFGSNMCGIVAGYVGQTVKVDFKFAADMTFTLLCLGFNGAHSDYCCYQCRLPKKHFGCVTRFRAACKEHKNVDPLTLCTAARSTSSSSSDSAPDPTLIIPPLPSRPLPTPLLPVTGGSAAPTSVGTLNCADEADIKPCCTGPDLPQADDPVFRARATRVLTFLTLEKHYLEMKNSALQQRLKTRKLDTKGQKKTLVQRILQDSCKLEEQDADLLAELRECDLHGSGDVGFIKLPIMRGISLKDVIIDLLHLKLRVGGKLLKLLMCGDVLAAERQDDVVREMKNAGVAFAFRATTDSKEGDGKVAWTSLMGTAMSKVLANFNVAAVVADPARAAKIQNIWRTFWTLFGEVLDWNGGDLAGLQQRLLAWLELFLELYGVNDITPYIHHFVTHLAEAVARHGGLRRYACEAAEKLNNLHQQSFHRATNKGGGRAQTQSKLKDPEYQILMRELRLRADAHANPEIKWHCPLCTNVDYVHFGWLLTHMAKNHPEQDLEKFEEHSEVHKY